VRLADVGHVRARAAIVAVDGVVPPVPVRGERVHVVVAGAYGVTARAPVDVVGPAAGVHPVRASNSCEGVVPVVPGYSLVARAADAGDVDRFVQVMVLAPSVASCPSPVIRSMVRSVATKENSSLSP
jgi:hypothetical protein